MKEELSIEEKAKRYDEILARATGAYLPYYTEDIMTKVREFVEYLLPELKEREDERIRKGLLYVIEHHPTLPIEEAEEYIGWVEKQGRQKLADKVELKFKVGDWIVDNCGYIWKIEEILNQFYLLEGIEGGESRPTIEWVNKTFHLWTIQDAKVGDILFQDLMGGKTFIFDGINPEMAILYSFIINNDGEDVLPYDIGKPNTGIGHVEDVGIIYPATKEQRDLLFQKMNDAGYEWDDKKKEPKKIEQTYTNNRFTPEQAIVLNRHIDKFLEEKPAWDEDEKIRKSLINYIYCYGDAGDYTKKEFIAWVKKQGEHANFLSKIQVGDKVTRNEAGILVNISQLNRDAKPANN